MYTARELNYLCRNMTLTEEDGEVKFVCKKCQGTGVIEIIGGELVDVIGYKRCSECNEE